ncbi:uncharacterized protein LOC128986471 isoform X3 [Macrosteles quadrilineatus]|uniref:uncharacterized protein LOC128986471 isoform X3 n=1 Tax=Macrosteles quadrilineatus TaxID=74068 RepID=UPI0023E13CB6|nr:uncharacterized protein LOC128986471 isoform X3 [Macrosteles quadrilineatus]XP_054262836.1 uncharacterized protein LOC128986471 isoform X3 [Macrosteles quadrilineatus]
MTAREIVLDGGSPWGFRMNGGADVGHALRISRVNPGSKAAQRGIREGDVITSINGQQTKSLTNGESHALLRSVEDTLRLGLNQDANGSPKRRSKEPLKREASSSSTPSTPVPASPLATPGDTQDPSGAQVYVRGIWNSVKKTKQQNKNNERKPEKVNEMCLEETVSKTTASKARRLRKLKLKSARQAEQSSKESRSTEIQDIQETEINTEEEKNVNNELIEITIEETVLTAPNVTEGKSHSDNLGSAKVGDGNGIPQSTNDANDLEKTCISKTKNKGKTKGFKLSKIFVTNTEQNSSNNNKSGPETAVACNDADQEIVNAKTRNYVNENATSSGDIEILRVKIDDVSNVAHSETTNSQCLEQTVVDSSDSHINTDLKNSEKIQDINALIKLTSSEFGDKIVNSSKITEATTVLDTSNQTDSSQIDVPSKIEIIDIVEYSSHSEDEFKSQNNKEQKSRPISIFVVPPDNIAQEAESIEIDWESVSDFEGRSLTISSDDDDVRPETLIHLPSNDMESSAALKDGRNGIVQVHDYELSVQDLYSRFMEPEEEARLRTFLETLNLSKPDEYDETSSSRSFGDSSSNTSMSENSPIPQTPADEVVIYRHLKTHSVAESCYIPPKRRHFLDVITEENSDPSDTEKRSGNINPWENPELIRKNNEIESIPNDWYDSDDEPEITSDDGGIDTSWGEGKQLDDVEGVEVVFLNSSSDDEMVLRKTFEEKLDNKQDNKNKAELVIVHIGNTEDVKKLTDVSPCLDSNKITSSKHAMEEIMAILDSTYEINKDLFNNPLVMNATCNETKIIKFDKSTLEDTSKCTSNLGCNHEIKSENKETKRNVMNLDSKYALPERSQTEKLNGETHSTGNQNLEAGFTEFPLPEESSVVFTPPMLSRQNSSSSATSQSTAKFNANQSPLSSEAEDKTDNQINRKIKSKKKVYNPKTLTHLSKEIITNLPHGEFYLQKIGFCNDDITETDVKESSRVTISNEKLTSLPPSGISTRRSSFYELENITHQQSYKTPYTEEDFSPRPVLLQSPPPSTLTSPPLNDDPWLGLPTSADRRLLVCLSPSQCKDNHINNPKEATELLELHKKFVERRGYHESSKRSSTFSPKSDRSHSPGFNSPDLIRLEPYKSNSAQGYTPELLIEAANLLALKEYRQSRLKSGPQSNSFKTPELTSVKINGNVLEKNGGLSEVTSPQTEINGDSEDPDANRSAGTSRLLALLQDGAPCCSPNNTASSEMVRVDKSDDTKAKRVHRYSGSYISEWLKMSENVNSLSEISSKTDINENVIHAKSANESSNESLTLNGFDKSSVEPRQFKADKYKISKKGDIAIMPEENEVKPPKKSDRPKSMPPVGVPALSPSGGEQFREQMYNEYMNKVAERFERRQQKVIKISNRPLSMCGNPETEVEKNAQIAPTNKLESEFLSKVRERMSKLGINLDEDPSGGEGGENADDAEELPKHLQEFMELTSQTPDAPDTGVWSPGTTPEPKRKEFNFTEAQEDSKGEEDPIPPVWTPKSAQASPTSERKFRPVNFESPTPTRKTYNQKSSEDTPKPPTDLPISVESPSHSSSSTSHSQLTSSSASYSHHETSSRLVTSSSLPDTSTLNPTITLLQKAREGQLPRGAHYLDQNSTNITENRSSSSLDKRSSPPSVRSNEVLYSTRREYESESEDKRPKKTVEITPKKYQGIGPTTKDGIPIVLRSEVQDENQHKWYKRMYDSLQRAEKDKEYVTVRYKTRRGRYPYTNSAGYLSEPEPLGGYDSDIASAKYATLDRRRIRNRDNDFTTSTMPRTNKYNAVKHAVDVYKNQPGRIEDYEPGHSSIADKEAKQWWDEVMDIFDGQFEQTQKSSPRTHTPATTGTSKPFMTYALKESGYESDSTLVFKRRDETQQQLSPAEQKQAYKVIQKGGDVPLHGLRKPVPEKPKEPVRGRVPAAPTPLRSYSAQQRPESPHRYVESEVTIHYRSPVRSEEKEAWPEEELQRRQAEAMRRIYQEERRRKYLQELQDMYSRRHTDNFIPSQKSPIPLNRYDDFVDDSSPGRPRDRTPEPKLVARALYNFVGQSLRELTFRRGDIIYVRRQIDKNWYEGEHNAMIGLFPINYVEIIPYDGIRTVPKRPTEGQARAKFNFQAQTHLELPLVKGELIVLTRRVDNNWFEGRIGTRKGIFPVSYVEVLVEPGERAMSPVRVNTPTKPVASPAAHSLHMGSVMSQHHYTPPRPVSYTSLPRQKATELKQPPVNQTLHIDTQNDPVPYRVLYNYKPQNEDELELVEGETVYVMEKCDDGWYVGSSQRTGYLGTFPGNYVERIV